MFALYKEGDTHVVDGVKCQIVRVELGDLDIYRADGWKDNIEDLYKEEASKGAKK